MPAPVEIDFQAGGVREVLLAFDSIESRMERFERTSVTKASAGATERTGSTKREVDQRLKEYEKLFSKVFKDEDKATAKAKAEAAARVQEAEKEANRRNQHYSRADAERVSSAERAAKKLEKIALDEAMVEERIFKQSMREREQIRERAAADAKRIAEKEAADARRIAAEAAAHEESLARRANMRYGRSMGSAAASSLGRTVGAVGMMAGMAMTVGGGFAVSGALRDEMAFGAKVQEAANEAYVAGDSKRTRAKASPEMIAALSRTVQASTHIGKVEVAEAIKTYVGKSSDFEGISATNTDTGRSNIEGLAMMAKATGGDFQEIVRAAAAMKASSKTMTSEQMMKNMRGILAAGKMGNLPIEELAASVPQITAGASLFTGSVTENQGKLLGLAQLVGPKAGSASETATAIKRMGESIMKQGPNHGMDDKMIYTGGDPTKGLLSPDKLVANVFRAAKGEPAVAGKILGREGFKVFEALDETYNEAGGYGAKNDAGGKAIEAKIRSFEGVEEKQSDIDQSFKNVMGTDAERLAGAMQHLHEVIAGAATPAFETFVNKLVDNQDSINSLITGLGKLANAFAENPIRSILALMAANVAKDVLNAGIGAAIREAVIRTMTQTAVGGEAGSAVPGAAGALAPGAAGKGAGVLGFLGAAGLVIGVGAAVASDAKEGEQAGKKSVSEMIDKMHKAEVMVKAGTMSQADANKIGAEAYAALSTARDSSTVQGTPHAGANTALGMASVPLAIVGAGDTKEIHKADEIVKSQEKLISAMQSLATAITAGADTTSGNAPVVRRKPINQHPGVHK
jgi:hypothetical protein